MIEVYELTTQAKAGFDAVSDSFSGLGLAQLAFGTLGSW